MIKYLKTVENRIIEINEMEKGCWVNVSNPDPEQLKSLSVNLNVPLDFLTDSLDIDERSRIETENGIIFFLLRVPSFDRSNVDIPYATLPVGIILSSDIIATVCTSDIADILDLSNSRIKNISTDNRNRFILHLFLRTAFFYLKYLKEINRKSNEIENELHKSMKNEALIKLLNIEKSLVFFTTSLRSNDLMMERLQKIKGFSLNEDDNDLLEDVIIDNRQAIEMANIYSNILSGMMDAFASVISNNLNIVMKFLTSVTIILMLPTLVASIYGMNVDLPFQRSPHAFLITIGISFSFSFIGVLIFLKNRWL